MTKPGFRAFTILGAILALTQSALAVEYIEYTRCHFTKDRSGSSNGLTCTLRIYTPAAPGILEGQLPYRLRLDCNGHEVFDGPAGGVYDYGGFYFGGFSEIDVSTPPAVKIPGYGGQDFPATLYWNGHGLDGICNYVTLETLSHETP